MLGFVAAVAVEAATGQNVIQQAKAEPFPIALISLTFIVASIIPIVRGVPRRGNSIFTADAELWNGRLVCSFGSLHVNLYNLPVVRAFLAVQAYMLVTLLLILLGLQPLCYVCILITFACLATVSVAVYAV